MVDENTALQVTDFDFYGDSLIALKDNATGEIYTAINSVLRGLGFKDEQVRYQRSKWINDISISKGVLKFNIPTNRGSQNSECINSRKLPIALAKINITKRMIKDYPDITRKLELYQDKCTDVLASVFIDKNYDNQFNTRIFTDTLNNLTSVLTKMDDRLSKLEEDSNRKKLPQKKYSRWKTNTFNKLNTLLSYTNSNSDDVYKLSEIISLVIKETEDTYSIEVNDYVDMYKSEYCLDIKPYALDVINHYKDIRDMFALTLDSIMERLHILHNNQNHIENIFDVLAAKLEEQIEMEERQYEILR